MSFMALWLHCVIRIAKGLEIEEAQFKFGFFFVVQASSETLQCPRCSASVNANPGVCSNCGENVYQCHKCRFSACFGFLLLILIL